MIAYRYRTATLLGPWRETRDGAVADAIRAQQARRSEDGIGWYWAVPGTIEEGHASSGSALGGGSASSRDPAVPR